MTDSLALAESLRELGYQLTRAKAGRYSAYSEAAGRDITAESPERLLAKARRDVVVYSYGGSLGPNKAPVEIKRWD